VIPVFLEIVGLGVLAINSIMTTGTTRVNTTFEADPQMALEVAKPMGLGIVHGINRNC
jgi:hypothetical protein